MIAVSVCMNPHDAKGRTHVNEPSCNGLVFHRSTQSKRRRVRWASREGRQERDGPIGEVVATKEHKDLKEILSVIHVISCGQSVRPPVWIPLFPRPHGLGYKITFATFASFA